MAGDGRLTPLLPKSPVATALTQDGGKLRLGGVTRVGTGGGHRRAERVAKKAADTTSRSHCCPCVWKLPWTPGHVVVALLCQRGLKCTSPARDALTNRLLSILTFIPVEAVAFA